ncbi:MAG: hypothetical protein HY761_08155 [Candidatus Omnitrophica bacterium]|nr:hypothetical protein [Candidatus Omnitrophota bacterium]
MKIRNNRQGAALILILGVILIITLLANVILTILSSQARLTHHQINRIRAYYANFAGINLALEKLRTGQWLSGQTWYLGKCSGSQCIQDADIPYLVTINIGLVASTIPGTTRIDITSNYASQ